MPEFVLYLKSDDGRNNDESNEALSIVCMDIIINEKTMYLKAIFWRI